MKRRLTLRDETGRAILNCYACKTEGRMICDYFSCKQRLIDRLADFEDAESREGKRVEVKDGKYVTRFEGAVAMYTWGNDDEDE